MEKVFEIYIKTTPERLWRAITDSELRSKYSFGVGIESSWSPARATWRATPRRASRSARARPRGRAAARLVQSFNALWSDG